MIGLNIAPALFLEPSCSLTFSWLGDVLSIVGDSNRRSLPARGEGSSDGHVASHCTGGEGGCARSASQNEVSLSQGTRNPSKPQWRVMWPRSLLHVRSESRVFERVSSTMASFAPVSRPFTERILLSTGSKNGGGAGKKIIMVD